MTEQHPLGKGHEVLIHEYHSGQNQLPIKLKLSWYIHTMIVISSLGVLFSVGFVSFLWFAWDENRTWRRIAHNEWMVPSVTSTSAVLRTAISIQAALVSSMLACLAFERREVFLMDLPIVYTFTGDTKTGLAKGSPSELTTTTAAISRWMTKPPMYPTFAEFHEDNAVNTIDGMSDTGTTMRAFLPFTDAPTRSSIKEYSGYAAVVNTRAPTLANCSINSEDVGSLYHADDWHFNLCYLPNDPAFLISDFYDVDTDANAYTSASNAFLAINQSKTPDDTLAFLELGGNKSLSVIKNHAEGDWFHLQFKTNSFSPSGETEGEFIDHDFNVSISLCFAALSGISSPILASAPNNRTEPVPRNINGTFSFEDVRRQLGQTPHLTSGERGILELEKEDWISRRFEASDTLDYIEDAGRMKTTTYSSDPATSLFLTQIRPAFDNCYADPMIAMLFQEILKTEGGIPFALQSAMTVLASMAYYDQTPFFDETTKSNQTFFDLRQIPGGQSHYLASPAGFMPGYLTVMCMLSVHCIVVAVVSWMFFYGTSISTLHNVWQVIAQLQTFPADTYLAKASFTKDKEVQDWIKADGHHSQLVGIAPSNTGVNTEIAGLRRRGEPYTFIGT
ncbi:hypothetical protein BU16DRAFT_565177 [Lophium mytilinum]|uniref:Uncharacterized protein n=1 Tax=Lophium mytilinum TaxID=390894 RepID=A0A6A6QGD9_9PEZI|nr:hypothetical protein BU16DRAFT_565177 [Lophium mytilinum]